MLIAGPNTRGPYPVHDVTPTSYDVDPSASPHAPLLARAATFYLSLDRDSEERRMIEYLQRRLSAPDIRTDPDASMLAHRLADIIRDKGHQHYA